ncbi:MAG: hypothetical protein ACUVWQ_09310 [Candidatus Aminicenantales bacterium]
MERCSGAMAADNEEWAGRQLGKAIKYERESGLTMVRVANKLKNLLKVVTSERVPDILLTSELIDDYRRSLSEEGFGPDELEACSRLNLTDEEIEEMKEKFLNSGHSTGRSVFMIQASGWLGL